MANAIRAGAPFHWFGITYAADATIDTSGWSEQAIAYLMQHAPVYVVLLAGLDSVAAHAHIEGDVTSLTADLSTLTTGLAALTTTVGTKLPIQEAVNAVATSGAAQTIPNVTVDTISAITLTADCTFTFPAAAAGKSFIVALKQDGTGSHLATWPGTVKWSGGTTPTLTTTINKTDVFEFICVDGTNWLGFTRGLNFA